MSNLNINQLQPPALDARLKLLSHSGICTLHKCPRLYQLRKLWPTYEWEDTVHTVYGKMFGAGVQALLAGSTIKEALWTAAMEWKLDLLASDGTKSFWHCWRAIEKFADEFEDSELTDYEVVIFEGKPAIELSFCIILPDGFYYRGYVDVVLRHKYSGQILCVDIKTCGRKYTHDAKFKNSAQVIGYSIVLDYVVPGLQTFDILYHEFMTELNKFEPHWFVIDNLQRAQWIQELLIDVSIMVNQYGPLESWPKRGESCYGWKPCTMIDTCDMATEHIIDTKPEAMHYGVDALSIDNKAPYQFTVTIEQLIAAQQAMLTT